MQKLDPEIEAKLPEQIKVIRNFYFAVLGDEDVNNG